MKNANTARIVMILAILVSVVFGSYRSLSSEAAKVEDVFYNGVDKDGIGIGSDLTIRTETAYNLVTVAKRYLDEGDAAVQAVLNARDALAEAGEIPEKYAANLRLSDACADLSEKLKSEALSAADERYRAGFMTELASRSDTISHDPYNALAAKFNAQLTAFPANLLSRLTGVEPLALFR